jgi:hypothetical protein
LWYVLYCRKHGVSRCRNLICTILQKTRC